MLIKQVQETQHRHILQIAIVDVPVFSDTIAFLRDTFSTLIPRIFALQVVMVCDPAHTIRQYLKVGDQNWQAFANVSQHLRQSVDSAKPLWFPTQAA